jgi:very-long-chain enoyl-CoA reductase
VHHHNTMKLQVQSRGSKKVLGEFDVTEKTTVQEFKRLYAKKFPKYYPERQRYTIPETNKPLEEGKTLGDYGLKEGSVVLFKDLGTQIGYRTVYIIEYFGPLLLYPVFYLFPSLFYAATARPHQFAQQVALLCWIVHYAKRVLESAFVHRFSHGTMPLFPNLPRNCAHYWLAGLYISYFVNHPLFTAPSDGQVYLGLLLFTIGEIGNLIAHVMLRNLRPEGSKDRKIPRGFLFELVSCPNYFFETLAWVGFTTLTQSVASFLFLLMGTGQMWVWGVQKHRRYKKDFDGKEGRPLYPRNRKVMFPFLM